MLFIQPDQNSEHELEGMQHTTT